MKLKVVIFAIFSVCFGNLKCEEEIYPKFTSSDKEIIKSIMKDLKLKESENKIFTSNFDINKDGNIDVIALRYGMENVEINSNCEVIIYFRDKNKVLEKMGSFKSLIALEEDGNQEELKIEIDKNKNEIRTDKYYFFEGSDKFSVYKKAEVTVIDTREHSYEDAVMRAKKLEINAEKGDIESQIKLGKKFHRKKEYETALKWYQSAFDRGGKDANVYITAIYYDKGDIINYNKWVNKDETKKSAENIRIEKEKLFMKKKDKSILEDYEAVLKCKNYKVKQSIAYYHVILKNYKKAKLWYKLAAADGMTVAMYNLGVLYEKEKIIDKALKWYKKSAEIGFIDSMFVLGEIYYFGYGDIIEKNYKEGIKWFELGKEKGDISCIGALGVAYFEGRGVKKDIIEAKKLWKTAAEKGNLESKLDLEAVEEYERIENKDENSFNAEKDGKYGIINGNFEWSVEPKYSEPIFVTNEKIVFNKNNKYGIMDKNEKVIVKPTYDFIGTMKDSFCFGQLNKKGEMVYGVKDYKEKILINPVYDYMVYFENGLACVNIKGKYGFIDKRGKTIIPAKYDNFSMFSNGVAVVSINNKYFAINEKGESIFKESYDYMRYFNDEYAVVKKENKYGVIDKKGKLIYPYQENEIFFYKDGIVIIIEENKYIIKNIENKLIINEKYDLAFFSIDDNIIVKKDESYGVLDKNGNYLMNLTNRFKYIGVFVNGVAVAGEISGKSVYINKRGRVVFE